MDPVRTVFRLLLGRRLPVVEGTVTVEGPEAPIVVGRDRYGVPSIEAAGEADAWFGLGFCHGQDRAFQLEGLLRVTRGTLAELVGADALPVDRLSRRIGFRRAARSQLAVLDDDIRTNLEAYAAGVNAAAKTGWRRRPHEFVLLRSTPTPWTAADVLALLGFMSFLLASNWDVELARYLVLTRDGPEALRALDPAYPEWLPVTSPPAVDAGPAFDALAEDLAAFNATVGSGGGSNNWAVAGVRTATGRPLLANDPHLAPVLPPHWYLARIRTPEFTVAGASFVGVPAIAVGFNGRCAWGVTAGLTDNTDLFVEEIGPDGRSVRQGELLVPCEVVGELIHVKGGDPVTEEVLLTPRGPVVGPALDGAPGALSMRAVWLDARPARGLLAVHHATDFDSFREAFRQWPGLPLNMVYADAEGHIGWQLVGEAPRRRKGRGALPLAGWDVEAGWEEDTWTIDDLPRLLDPVAGWVATANAKPRRDDAGGAYLGCDFIDGYRAARIGEVLADRDDWDLPATAGLQMDQVSIPWRELRRLVLDIPCEGDAAAALEVLAEWNGVVGAASAGAAVFELFLVALARRVVEAKAPATAAYLLGKGFSPISPETVLGTRRVGHLVRLLRERPEGWFAEGWDAVVAEALAEARRVLVDRFGDDPTRWSWGELRQLTLKHPFGEKPPLGRVFDLGPFPWGGDGHTVAQASVSFLDPHASPAFIASLRMVVDVGDWDDNRFVLPGGQSGNPLSPHYADLLPLWRTGGGVPVPFGDASTAEAVRHRLEIRPG